MESILMNLHTVRWVTDQKMKMMEKVPCGLQVEEHLSNSPPSVLGSVMGATCR